MIAWTNILLQMPFYTEFVAGNGKLIVGLWYKIQRAFVFYTALSLRL